MKRIVSIVLVALLVMSLALAGCAKSAPTPTPTPVPTPTPTRAVVVTPTLVGVATPTPTPLPAPTATTAPTATRAPTPTPVPVKPIELKQYCYASTTARAFAEQHMRWANELEKRTGGRVKVTVYPSEALGPYAKVYDLVRTGVADVTVTMVPTYTPGVFPLTEVIALPFAVTDKWRTTSAMSQLYEKGYLKDEWREVKLLYVITFDPYEILTSKKPVRTLEDLRGLRIRASGAIQEEALKKLGAVAVPLAGGEIYMAMERSVVDGALLSVGTLTRLKLIDVTNYVTRGFAFATLPTAGIMNKGVWDRLPPDIQKIVDELSLDAQKWGIDAIAADDLDGWAAAKQKGIEPSVISPAEVEKARELVLPIWDNWVAQMEAKGLPGKKFVEEYMSLVR